jgi:hypothetical protein
MTISMLLSDPAVSPPVCCLERIPRDGKKLNVRVLSGISHWIQFECPDAIMDAIPLPRAKLWAVRRRCAVSLQPSYSMVCLLSTSPRRNWLTIEHQIPSIESSMCSLTDTRWDRPTQITFVTWIIDCELVFTLLQQFLKRTHSYQSQRSLCLLWERGQELFQLWYTSGTQLLRVLRLLTPS